MYIDLTILPNQLQSDSEVTVSTGNCYPFPAVVMGRQSYVVNAKLITGLQLQADVEMSVHNIHIGRYCAMAEDITFMIDMNHIYCRVFQGEVAEIKGGAGEEPPFRRKGQILIGNDVWVGHGVTIMMGVTINDGAIIGTDALVTKDVPPYAIVGGNPAKIIGYRFEPDIIEKLMRISWWDWTPEELSERKNDFYGDTRAFAEKYDCKTFLDTEEWPIDRVSDGKVILYYLDIDQRCGLWKKVIKSFIEYFHDTNTELLLYLDPKNPQFEQCSALLFDYLEKFQEYNCYINISSDYLEDDALLLKGADYWVTNRMIPTVHRMHYAYLAGTKIISGVDIPIFDEKVLKK